jgi:hypothetical protein
MYDSIDPTIRKSATSATLEELWDEIALIMKHRETDRNPRDVYSLPLHEQRLINIRDLLAKIMDKHNEILVEQAELEHAIQKM